MTGFLRCGQVGGGGGPIFSGKNIKTNPTNTTNPLYWLFQKKKNKKIKIKHFFFFFFFYKIKTKPKQDSILLLGVFFFYYCGGG
ncbi:hypothetical protein, partial [Stenotrophomonas muris]|uniref:hypothetical protein n=1 Tax=Stenotrophomonas muris TaxID=2963283 RepID=UPI00383BF2C0